MRATNTYSLRPAREDEYDVISSIRADASRMYGASYVARPIPVDFFITHCEQQNISVAVDRDDNPYGFSLAFCVNRDIYLRHFYVRKDCQRRGLGTKLLTAVVRRAEREKARAVTLTTSSSAAWSFFFYKQHGFNVISKDIPDYLQNDINAQIRNFSVEVSPFILSCPSLLPRVAMERLVT